MLQDERSKGIAAGIGAYSLWGLLPIYWKLLGEISAGEVLAHRIVWSFLFLILLFWALRKLGTLKEDLRYIKDHPKISAGIMLSAFFISINWILFIWAVAAERVVEVSLGYYINPLINVVLGVLFFKESLSNRQRTAVGLAVCGVLILTISFGQIPYVALALAFSFGMYGLVKKQTQIGAMTGLILETMFLLPPAIVYLLIIHRDLSSILYLPDLSTALLLAGTGAATAVPLLLFGSAARLIPLSLLGFLQYIAPTSMLFLGVLVYGEPFTAAHGAAFAFIWTALLLYSIRPKRKPSAA
ncbi:EamA family transporter RarD [Alkalicoccus urumqiensis]|uniref:EamA family transporter RarD n=1 Tax=Alkalicoccus urumqiensis TaxID=1548213 RepID=A0A2P6MEX0_ALKUR|nr:EamA family transporter RarD [Alkalicoccus urumqiensis]PRO64828.1 EamA family transporter RarD [Alkalicoccus urumqiensis]